MRPGQRTWDENIAEIGLIVRDLTREKNQIERELQEALRNISYTPVHYDETEEEDADPDR